MVDVERVLLRVAVVGFLLFTIARLLMVEEQGRLDSDLLVVGEGSIAGVSRPVQHESHQAHTAAGAPSQQAPLRGAIEAAAPPPTSLPGDSPQPAEGKGKGQGTDSGDRGSSSSGADIAFAVGGSSRVDSHSPGTGTASGRPHESGHRGGTNSGGVGGGDSSGSGGGGGASAPVIHTFVINLNTNVDRHFVAENRVRDQPGFEFHHVPAVNGRALKNGCGGPMQGADAGPQPMLDLECVTQAHVKAMVMGAEYLTGEDDFVLIMEDDVSFGLRDFWRHRSLRHIARGWSETHCDWSLVLLAPWLQDKHWAGMYYHYLTESTNWQLLRKQRGDTFWGAAAYAINAKGMREAFEFLGLKQQDFPVRYDDATGAPVPFFNLHASPSNYYCAAPRQGGVLPAGVNATILSDCMIFDAVEAPYISLPPLFVWDSSAIYSSTLHKDHEDAQGRGREKILEFALAVHDLDAYHHRICSVISGFATLTDSNTENDAGGADGDRAGGDASESTGSGSDKGGSSDTCLHVIDTAVVGVDSKAQPLRSLALRDVDFPVTTPEELTAAKLRFCCQQCEEFEKTDTDFESWRRGLRLVKKHVHTPQLPSAATRHKFLHLDDHKCAIWHVDAQKQYCHLWNANRGVPRSWPGHFTGIPEGQCPTQLSNTAVTPHQVCREYPLPPDAVVSAEEAQLAFEMGTRPVVSRLKFPQALLLPTVTRARNGRPLATAAAVGAGAGAGSGNAVEVVAVAPALPEFHTSATCVSRVDQAVSGFRNQTMLRVPSVDACCAACEASPRCKAWTFDTRTRSCYVFVRTALHLTAFYKPAEGFVGGLVTERFCDMSPEGLADPGSFVLPNTDIKGWDILLPGIDQGFFAYSAQHCCVLVAAMDEYRLHGWTFDGTWNRCYPKVSRVGGMSLVDSSRSLTSGILLQGVPKCAVDKCILPNVPDTDHGPGAASGSDSIRARDTASSSLESSASSSSSPAQAGGGQLAFCDGTLDFVTGKCINSRRKERGYDCRDCMHCHDACQGFLFNQVGGYHFDERQICHDFLSEWGHCTTDPALAGPDSLDCRGCRIRSKLYNGKCSHLCQYPERCSHWFSSEFECVPNFIYGFIIADCNACEWPTDDLGLSVE